MSTDYVTITTILTIAVGTCVAVFLVNDQLLLYLNELTITTRTDVSVYVIISALQFGLRIPGSLILGWTSGYFGPTRTLAATLVVSCIGIFFIIWTRPNSIALAIGYILFCQAFSTRQLRMSILSDAASPENRTALLMIHTATRHLSYLLGPFLWILIQKWQGSTTIYGHIVDRFTVSHVLAIFTCIVVITLACTIGSQVKTPNRSRLSQNHSDLTSESTPLIIEERGTDQTPPSFPQDASGNTVIERVATRPEFTRTNYEISFRHILLLRLTCAAIVTVWDVSFQPVVIDLYGAGEEELGLLYMYGSILGMLLTIALSCVSYYTSDLNMMMISGTVMMMGHFLNLDLFGPIHKWQIVVGFIVCARALVFQPIAMSVFIKGCKTLQQRERGIAICNSAVDVVVCVIRLCLARHLLKLFGKWYSIVVVLPLLFTLIYVYLFAKKTPA